MSLTRLGNNFFLEGSRLDNEPQLGSAPVVRTRLGNSMLPRAPFGNSFVLERPVLTASVGPAPAGGCAGSPFQQFFCRLESLRRGQSGCWMLPWARFGSIFV